MTAHALFPTCVYTAALQTRGARELNRRLFAESLQLREDDGGGRRWSAVNYPGGYTSYGSAHRLHRISPTFESLRLKLQRHVEAFSAEVQWALAGRELSMTDCWINIMSRQAAHASHLHPLSTLSGIYYVRVPPGSAGIKFEDPRLDRFMAAPPRRLDARRANRTWITIPAVAGRVVLFESWLRHEVPANPVASDRVSVSFNYNWF